MSWITPIYWIDKEALFELLASHSKLAQEEYECNPKYNNEHFSHKAETKILKNLKELNLLDEFFDYAEKKFHGGYYD